MQMQKYILWIHLIVIAYYNELIFFMPFVVRELFSLIIQNQITLVKQVTYEIDNYYNLSLYAYALEKALFIILTVKSVGYLLQKEAKDNLNQVFILINTCLTTWHCAQCKPGFVPINGACDSIVKNCKTPDLSASTKQCLQCNSGYTLSNGACELICPSGSVHPTPTQIILCVPSIANCPYPYIQNGNSWQCSGCSPGYIFPTSTSKTTCIAEVSNCTTYTLNAVVWQCSACKLGHIFPTPTTKTVCVAIIQNCSSTTYVKNANNVWECSACSPGFTYPAPTTKVFCAPIIPSCSIYVRNQNNSWVCSICGGSSIYSTPAAEGKICFIKNCEIQSYLYTSPTVNSTYCQKCSQGYYLDQNRLSCYIRDNYCTSYDKLLINGNTKYCDSCDENHYLTTKLTTSLPNACYPTFGPAIANCQSYANEPNALGYPACTKCRKNYTLHYSGKCIPAYKIPGCYSYSYTKDDSRIMCDLCTTGIRSIGGFSCVAGTLPSNCKYAEYSSTDASLIVCSLCNPSYALSRVNKTCISASTPYACQHMDMFANGTIICSVCITGYKKGVDGTCIYDTITYSYSSYNRCFSLYSVPGNPGTTKCEICVADHVLVYPISNASQTPYSMIPTPECWPITSIANCDYPVVQLLVASQTLSTTFRQCSLGYYKNAANTTCTLVPTANVISNCLTYETSSTGAIVCQTCMDGYQRSNDKTKCLLKIPNCLYNFEETGYLFTCKFCPYGYVTSIDKKSCVQIPNCVYYIRNITTSSITCQYCRPGYELSADQKQCNLICPANSVPQIRNSVTQCVAKIANCDLYYNFVDATNTWECSDCLPGFKYQTPTTKTVCVPIIADCATYVKDQNNNWICSQCDTPYTVAGSGKFCLMENCQVQIINATSYAKQCVTCKSGYTLSIALKKCFANIQNCLEHDVNNTLGLFCKVCSSITALSLDKSSCITPKTTQRVPPNCLQYTEWKSSTGESFINCTKCQPYHALHPNGECIKVKSITGCQNYMYNTSGAFYCRRCNVNYIKQVDQMSCTATTAVNNCKYYERNVSAPTNVICQGCNQDYTLSQVDRSCTLLGSTANTVTFGFSCPYITKSATGAYVCEFCPSGFVLQKDKTCKSGTVTPIPNCAHYALDANDKVICQYCSAGYLLSQVNQVECLQVRDILNCQQLYYGSDTLLYCRTCQAGYSLENTKKSCIKETSVNIIPYCSEVYYTPTPRTAFCNKCMDGYLPYSTGNCSKAISNCYDKVTSSLFPGIYLCKSCQAGFVLDFDLARCWTVDKCSQISANSTSYLNYYWFVNNH